MKKIIPIIAILILILLTLTGCEQQKQNDDNFTVVTSFYPMYILTKNITNGIEGVNIQNMASQNVGCLHEYTLTASDLMKVEKADVFIINGLGIENFTEKILETYAKIHIIDSSKNIDNIKKDEHEKNAHIWLDINKYEEQLENIKQRLIELDSDHAENYKQNAEIYKQKLQQLKNEIEVDTKTLKKCVSFSSSLAYLEDTMNLQMEIIETDHENSGLSAEKLSQVIKYVKENNIKNIILDETSADNNAQIIANETGAKIYRLNSGLSGNGESENYITMMKENLQIVKNMEE